jgi:hypothetical protein
MVILPSIISISSRQFELSHDLYSAQIRVLFRVTPISLYALFVLWIRCVIESLECVWRSLFASSALPLKEFISTSQIDLHYLFIFRPKILRDLVRHYLHMSDATKDRLKSEVDEFGDFYFLDVDESDLIQVRHIAWSPAQLNTFIDARVDFE